LSLAADLFLETGRTVLLPDPHPPGYPEIFTLRTRADLRLFPAPQGRPDAGALARLLERLPETPPATPATPAMVVLRTPVGPGEPALAGGDRQALIAVLAAAARVRPLVAALDDVFEREGSSLFWDLLALHPNLIPLKVDGTEGELGFPGSGVGFFTLPFAPESEMARALEGKIKMLLRAVVGSPPTAGQAVLLAGLPG
jgi:hypothetical protein